MHVVADDADVVRRGVQVSDAWPAPAVAFTFAGTEGGDGVGRGGRARLHRGRPDVAGRILGSDAVVVRAGGEAAVDVGRAGRLRDPVRGASA